MLGSAEIVSLRVCWRGEAHPSKAQEEADGTKMGLFSGSPKKCDARAQTARDALSGRYYGVWYRYFACATRLPSTRTQMSFPQLRQNLRFD